MKKNIYNMFIPKEKLSITIVRKGDKSTIEFGSSFKTGPEIWETINTRLDGT